MELTSQTSQSSPLSQIQLSDAQYNELYNAIMIPLLSLEDLIDISEGQNGSIKCLLSLIVQNTEERLDELRAVPEVEDV